MASESFEFASDPLHHRAFEGGSIESTLVDLAVRMWGQKWNKSMLAHISEHFQRQAWRSYLRWSAQPGSGMRAKKKPPFPQKTRFLVQPSERGNKTRSVYVADSLVAPKCQTSPAQSAQKGVSCVLKAKPFVTQDDNSLLQQQLRRSRFFLALDRCKLDDSLRAGGCIILSDFARTLICTLGKISCQFLENCAASGQPSTSTQAIHIVNDARSAPPE